MLNKLNQVLEKLPFYEKAKHLYSRLQQRLWYKPLLASAFSILIVFSASYLGSFLPEESIPKVQLASIEKLLNIMANSLLAVATFAVSSMVAAYASASNVASPRSFSIVVSDDKSKNALSTFIGVFIFSVIGLTAIKNEFYTKGGVFILFCTTVLLFVVVVLVFVRWVDAIARLGRLGETIDRVKKITEMNMTPRTICGIAKPNNMATAHSKYLTIDTLGYVQKVFIEQLQALAEHHECFVEVSIQTGDSITPNTELMKLHFSDQSTEIDEKAFLACIEIGKSRLFDDNPIFGIEVLAEIGNKALSPGINDNGTAKQVIQELICLLYKRERILKSTQDDAIQLDRIYMPSRSASEYLEVAFTDTILYASANLLVMKDLVHALNKLLEFSEDNNLKEAIDNTLLLIKKRTDLNMSLEEDRSQLRIDLK